MSIGTRIALGFAVVLLLTGAVAVIGWNGLDTYAGRVETATRAAALDTKLQQARLEASRYMIEGDPSAARRVRGLTDELRADAEALSTSLGAEALEAVRARVKDFRDAFEKYIGLEANRRAAMAKLGKQITNLTVAANEMGAEYRQHYARAIETLRTSTAEPGQVVVALNTAFALRLAAVRLVAETRGAMVGVQQFLIEGGTNAQARVNEAIDRMLDVTGEARRTVTAPDALARIDQLTPAVLATEQEFRIMVDVAESQIRAREAMKAVSQAVGEQVAAIVERELQERESGRAWATRLIGLGTLGALGLGAVFAVLIGRGIVRPLAAVTDAVERVSQGDVDVAVPGRDRPDELGAIGRAVARVIEVLHGLHHEMHRLSGRTVDEPPAAEAFHGLYGEMVELLQGTGAAFRQIGEQATQVAVAAGQARAAVKQVSDGATTQTDDLDSVASAVGQTVQAIGHVSGSTRTASEMVRQAAGFAEQGRQDMDRMLRLAQTIAENSRRIGRITEAITQIAVKTNILSVNASIEAARAGEQGRGFEVVAEEVGKLADNAVESAAQIQEIIESAMKLAEESRGVTEQASVMMGELSQRVVQLDRMFQSIAVSMEEQQTSIRAIEANVDSVRLVASRNAAASEEIAATMTELSWLAEETRRQAARFQAV